MMILFQFDVDISVGGDNFTHFILSVAAWKILCMIRKLFHDFIAKNISLYFTIEMDHIRNTNKLNIDRYLEAREKYQGDLEEMRAKEKEIMNQEQWLKKVKDQELTKNVAEIATVLKNCADGLVDVRAEIQVIETLLIALPPDQHIMSRLEGCEDDD